MNEFKNYAMICGMEVSDILDLHFKLDVIGIDIKDVNQYLDRDNVQLLAEMQRKIKSLESKLGSIKEVVNQ